MNKIKVGNKLIGPGEPTFIIAEAGINHNGDFDIAKKMVDVGVIAGADTVKFQKRNLKEVFINDILDAIVTKNGKTETYFEYKRRGELSNPEYYELSNYCKEKGIMFFASPWDKDSADFLEELKVPLYKIASADLTNSPLVEHVAGKMNPIILSTGMSTLEEIEAATKLIRKYHDKLILLQCTSTYPSKIDEVNLRAIRTLREKFNLPVGYSGHEPGIAISVAAAALGAVVVERHFTLDRAMPGPDQAASLEPQGLMKMIRDIRTVEKAQGSPEKCVLPAEEPLRRKLAKSIVAAKSIPEGETITRDMLTTKSPGTGLSPQLIDSLIGIKAPKDFQADTMVAVGERQNAG